MVKGCLTALIFFIAIFVIIAVIPERRLHEKVRKADHAAILSACRSIISNSIASNRPPFSIGRGDPLFTNTVPSPILNLSPAYVTIMPDHAMICLSALPRVYVLAFATNAVQYGGEKLIDGLWLSHGPRQDYEALKTKNK